MTFSAVLTPVKGVIGDLFFP